MSHQVQLASSAIRDLDRIAPRIVPAIIEFIYGPLSDNPRRLGKALRNELEGLHGARRGDYRVLYEIDDEHQAVLVTRIERRGRVYKTR